MILEGVERRVTRRGQETIAEYQTPVGSLRTAEIFTEEMLDGGASIPWTSEHAIRQPADFDTAAYIFSHLRVEPRAGAWERRSRVVGDRGIAVAYVIGTACPIHHIMKELMPVEQFFLAQHDYPEKIDLLAEAMQPYYAAMQRVAAETGAESPAARRQLRRFHHAPEMVRNSHFPGAAGLRRDAARQGQVPDDSHRRRKPAAHPACTSAPASTLPTPSARRR